MFDLRVRPFSYKYCIPIANGMIFSRETFDLGGATVLVQTLPWSPWFTLFDCDPETLADCDSSGILSDVIKTMAEQFNFTIDLRRHPNSKWGVLPVTGGWYDYHNATFEGILGKTIYDEVGEARLTDLKQVLINQNVACVS